MTIEQIDSSKVLIVLGSSDMKDFSLEYSTLSFSDPHSRRILSRLLKLACTKAGLETENKKLFVEALPHKSGCLILLTLTPKSQRRVFRVKKSDKELCCIFDELEPLICASIALSRSILPNNSVYNYENRYYLLIENKPLSIHTLALLEEFCDSYVCTKTAAARIRENGSLIADKTAVKTFAAAFA